jgi:hypothetical protein
MRRRNAIFIITIAGFFIASGVVLFAIEGLSRSPHKVPDGASQSFFSKNDRDAFYRGMLIQGADASNLYGTDGFRGSSNSIFKRRDACLRE